MARARSRIALVVLLACAPLTGCGRPDPGRVATADLLCPRPQGPVGAQREFSAQEQAIRALRQQAFGGDFFAQLDLARRYSGPDAREKNLEDPKEAAVWFELALTNLDGYAPTAAVVEPRRRERDRRPADCRAGERQMAAADLERLLERMSSDERSQVRARVIYVLSMQGAPGFRTLARLHDNAFAVFGDPYPPQPTRGDDPRPVDAVAGPAAASLFLRNDVDVYLYNFLAAQAGDVAGYVRLKDFERASPDRAKLGIDAEAKARRWVPPFEFYPPDAPDTGVPHSDESAPAGESHQAALARLDELPFVHIGEALAYLQVTPRPVRSPRELSVAQVKAFQAMLGRPPVGVLSQTERLRAIQYAAVDGSPKAQLALAVMYAEGIGVVRDYARAFHWFAEADRQGSPQAKYAMSTYFSLGVTGVADQDKAAAVVYQLDGALSGFRPSAERLQGVLAQVGRTSGSLETISSRSHR
jgi:TPR repeat protein